MYVSGNLGLGNRVSLGKLIENHGGYLLMVLEERDTCKEKDSGDKFISVPSSEVFKTPEADKNIDKPEFV